MGRRTIGKLGNNSSYGGYGLDWDAYGIVSSDKSNLTIGCFISAYARIETTNLISYVLKNKGKEPRVNGLLI